MGNDMQIILEAFPNVLADDIKSIFKIIDLKSQIFPQDDFEVQVDNELLKIPYRIYYDEPDSDLEDKLSLVQKQILDCIFTRHNDGYIRQKRLNNLFIRGSIQKWIIPYVAKLMGEYVVEIIEDIYRNIELINQEELKEFVLNNTKFCTTIEGRIASYCGEYYMTYSRKNEYVGFKIQKYIRSLRK